MWTGCAVVFTESPDAIQTLAGKMDVETFVKEFGGERPRSYKGGWLIQCPFPEHTDNSPSFSLSSTGLFHCWGCDRKGNYTRLLHDVAQYSWKKATETVSNLNLRRHWTKQLRDTYSQEEARTISAGILGLYDRDWETAYNLWEAHREVTRARPPWAMVFDKGFIPKTLEHFDAGYDSDEQRITIPIWNEKRNLLGLLGRACRQAEFKYVPYFQFQYTRHVYNLQDTNEGETVVLVEGAFDVWMLHQWKIPFTAIATMTSHIKEEQAVQILEKHANILIFYDGDDAGQHGATQAARLLTKKGGRVDIVRPTKGVENIKDMDYESFMAAYERRKAWPSR